MIRDLWRGHQAVEFRLDDGIAFTDAAFQSGALHYGDVPAPVVNDAGTLQISGSFGNGFSYITKRKTMTNLTNRALNAYSNVDLVSAVNSASPLQLILLLYDGAIGSLATAKPVRTVGSYWPYATTLFDYTRRSMPITNPLSLSDNEVYAVTAYLLYLNGIIGANDVMNAQTLPQVKMPNRDGFIDMSRK